MGKNLPVPSVDVAVALIVSGDRILTVYNPLWSAFTLPMTKLHRWTHPTDPDKSTVEAWPDGAVRAAAEWLGRTLTTVPKEIADEPGYEQGDRTGEWKRYHFKVFRFDFDAEPDLAGGAVVEWLTKAEIINPDRKPIAKTARDLVAKALP